MTFAAQFDDGPLGHLGRQSAASSRQPSASSTSLNPGPCGCGPGSRWADRPRPHPRRLFRFRRGRGRRSAWPGNRTPRHAGGRRRRHPSPVRGWTTLAEAVHVHDDGQVVQVVIGRLVECSPKADPFSQFLLSPQSTQTRNGSSSEVAAGQSDPDGIRRAVPGQCRTSGYRASTHGKTGVRVALQAWSRTAGTGSSVRRLRYDARRLEHQSKAKARRGPSRRSGGRWWRHRRRCQSVCGSAAP